MDETAVFEERPITMKVLHGILGVCLLGPGLFLDMVGVLYGRYIIVFIGSPLIVAGAFILYYVVKSPGLRTVAVDQWGVRFFLDGRLDWALPWTAMRSIGTKRKNPERSLPTDNGLVFSVPGTGYKAIFFATGHESYLFRLGQNFGPMKAMKELFNVLARYAVQRNIAVEDGLGWLTGSETLPREGLMEKIFPGGILIPPANLDFSSYERKLYGAERRLIRGFSTMGFDRDGLCLETGKGRWISLHWNQVRRCRLDTNTRWLFIDTVYCKWAARIDDIATLPFCKAFNQATGRPAEAWSSGE